MKTVKYHVSPSLFRSRTVRSGLLLGALLVSSAHAEVFCNASPNSCHDFPQGVPSFADVVTAYEPVYTAGGDPSYAHRLAAKALGPPDYAGGVACPSQAACSYVSLGPGGRITLQFTNNVLTGSGSTNVDLWIFEVGPDVENTFVEVSRERDGLIWYSVGSVAGGTRGVDLDAFGFGPNDRFAFVRLRDDPVLDDLTGNTVGADIDAVGAISSAAPRPLLDISHLDTLGQDVLVANLGDDRVRRFDRATGRLLGYLGDGSGLDGPTGLAFGPDGNLYVCSSLTDSIKRFDGTNGTFLGDFVSSGSGGLDTPFALQFGSDGNLYVSTSSSVTGQDYVRVYSGQNGSNVWSLPLGELNDGAGMAFGPDGKLYVSGYVNQQVKRFDPVSRTYLGNFTTGSSLGGPTGLAFGPDGHLYVACVGSRSIKRFNGQTGAFMGDFVTNNLNQPFHLAFGSDGNLYVADYGSNSLTRFNGVNGQFLGSAVQAGALQGPVGVVFSPTPILTPGAYAQVQLIGLLGHRYRIECSEQVPNAVWPNFAEFVLTGPCHFVFDPSIRQETARFYRAIKLD